MRHVEEVKIIINNHRYRIINAAASVAAYTNWSNQYSAKMLQEAWIGHDYDRLQIEEILQLPPEELRSHGYIYWDERIILIPLWMYNLIADGETLVCIDDTTAVKGKDNIDLDIYGGCIAYGFYLN